MRLRSGAGIRRQLQHSIAHLNNCNLQLESTRLRLDLNNIRHSLETHMYRLTAYKVLDLHMCMVMFHKRKPVAGKANRL